MPALIRFDRVSKTYPEGDAPRVVLREASAEVAAGEIVAIRGRSGSGKSTLLNLVAGLDSPTSGDVWLGDVAVNRLSPRERTLLRRDRMGFVFQFFNLIPTLTALENVALPIQFAAKRKYSPNKRAKELLEMLGVGDRLHHRPSQLSGGQQQRVAIARALANNPPLLLGDEPTGSLDSGSSEVVMKALRDVQRHMNTTVILVTHNMEVASQVDRLVTLVDGHLAEDTDPRTTAQIAAARMLREKRATGEIPMLPLEGR